MMRAEKEARERALIWPQRADGRGIDTARAMTALARKFPTLRGVPGVDPWDALAFLRWACSPAPSSGAYHAAKFMLGVWSPDTDWTEEARAAGILSGDQRIARFDLFQAMGTWDVEHRRAVMTWIHAPFWP
jgi:hypothetical protein